MYRYITTAGSFVQHTHLSNIVLFVAVMATALLARSGFCGWVCPLGFVQELISNLSNDSSMERISFSLQIEPQLCTMDVDLCSFRSTRKTLSILTVDIEFD